MTEGRRQERKRKKGMWMVYEVDTLIDRLPVTASNSYARDPGASVDAMSDGSEKAREKAAESGWSMKLILS